MARFGSDSAVAACPRHVRYTFNSAVNVALPRTAAMCHKKTFLLLGRNFSLALRLVERTGLIRDRRNPTKMMMANQNLIATIVVGLGFAFVFGALAHRLRIPLLIGYLIAGVIIGPFTPGYVADQALARQLAEVGVILLMFGVGLHFSLHDLLSVRAVAIPGAIGQMALVSALGFGLAHAMGWPTGAGVVFGLALSVASTVVVLRALQERRLIDTDRGRIVVGWLIIEDLAMVLVLVLLPALAPLLGGQVPPEVEGGWFDGFLDPHSIWSVLGLTLAKLAAYLSLMLVVGQRFIPFILHYVAHSGSRELFRLAVLALALSVAFGSAQLFGVSFALGAFFAGMVLAESTLSQQAAQETLPLRDAFAVLFFVSVGMLFDPGIIMREPGSVLATFLIIVGGNALAAFLIVLSLQRGLPVADWRILIHPRQPRCRAPVATRKRPGPDPCRSHPFHSGKPTPLLCS